MKHIRLLIVLTLLIAMASSYTNVQQEVSVVSTIKASFLTHIKKQKDLCADIKVRIKNNQSVDVPAMVIDLRNIFSEYEHLISHYFPDEELQFNNPPVPRYNDDLPDDPPIPPSGFQLLEEMVYEDTMDTESILKEFDKLIGIYTLIEQKSEPVILDESTLFDAYREQLVRIAAIYLSGNDAPVNKGAMLDRTCTSLTTIKDELLLFNQQIENPATEELSNAIAYIKKLGKSETKVPEKFDHFNFYSNHLSPAYTALNRLQASKRVAYTEMVTALNPVSDYMNANNTFNTNWFAKDQSLPPTSKEIIELGKLLFFDPILSVDMKRSCASCHQPGKAFTDGLAKNNALDVGELKRNTPTIINCGLQGGQFWDLRVNFLETQVKHVVGNEKEMKGDWANILALIENSNEYTSLFAKAYNYSRDTAITVKSIVKAITMYERSLVALNSNFDQALQGKKPVDEQVKSGFNLFMNKAACGACHFFPLFNGTTPPRFFEAESEVLGTPVDFGANKKILDTDMGRVSKMKQVAFNRSFKTPTIRNAAYTPPYMHHGGFKTLEEVIDFYNEGGGKGMGLDVGNQTLPGDSLRLTAFEKKALVCFIQSLNDTVGTTSMPARLPDLVLPNKKVIRNRKP